MEQREGIDNKAPYDVTGLYANKALIAIMMYLALINTFFD